MDFDIKAVLGIWDHDKIEWPSSLCFLGCPRFAPPDKSHVDQDTAEMEDETPEGVQRSEKKKKFTVKADGALGYPPDEPGSKLLLRGL